MAIRQFGTETQDYNNPASTGKPGRDERLDFKNEAGDIVVSIISDADGNKWLEVDGEQVVAASGDVVGPASSTDNAIARFDGTTGELLQDSGLTVSDNAAISGLRNGYGAANAGLIWASGTQMSSNGDGALFIGSSGSNSGFLFSMGVAQAQIGSGFQFAWTSTNEVGAGSADTGFKRTAAGIIGVTNGSTGGGSLGMQEVTAPSAPAANGVYIYAEDNGSGKTRLMALFGSGAAQQIAIEP